MAVEAKEGLEIQSEGVILGAISLQHFMQCYPQIAGMTATALQSAEELANFYGLEVVIIPPNLACKRIDQPDIIFSHKEAKIAAVIQEIKRSTSNRKAHTDWHLYRQRVRRTGKFIG